MPAMVKACGVLALLFLNAIMDVFELTIFNLLMVFEIFAS